ncbi:MULTISPECIES: MBL fold metallo-hydrolase [unclassified Thioalkalivibrio]|uniref:MBL fold metallo-hydrolase n=1 Tax=unclassified Thioalkalivibrio TaxID=2621013 RepID=UPI00037F67DF|nr:MULTISPECIES: MBL fold metallo-hydrolase [unclassified Thioalkalivibrio]
MLRHLSHPVTSLAQNATLIWCDATGAAAWVDPGADAAPLEQIAREHGVHLEKILLTHGHLDHVGATAELAARANVPVIGPHRDDAFWLDQLPAQAQIFGFPETAPLVPDQWLEDGDTIALGQTTLRVLHCPGHTPGHVVFHDSESGLALVGDVLFHGAIGRSDFPRGNGRELIASITDKLWPLGDETRFVPGHGPESTFGEERRSNPFVGDAALAAGGQPGRGRCY